jgi:hypothetical protein
MAEGGAKSEPCVSFSIRASWHDQPFISCNSAGTHQMRRTVKWLNDPNLTFLLTFMRGFGGQLQKPNDNSHTEHNHHTAACSLEGLPYRPIYALKFADFFCTTLGSAHCKTKNPSVDFQVDSPLQTSEQRPRIRSDDT